jgi:hypothetical protein
MVSSDCSAATSFPPSTNSRRLPFHQFVRSLDEESVEAVLGGDLDILETAFVWLRSPQGNEYWWQRCCGEVPLSDDDKAMLRRWLIIKDMPEAFIAGHLEIGVTGNGALRAIVDGRCSTELLWQFPWEPTSQGHDYWRERCYGYAPLSDEDKEWLLALAELNDRIEEDLQAGLLRRGSHGLETVPAAEVSPVPAPAPSDSPLLPVLKQAIRAKGDLEAAISTLLADFCRQYGATIDEVIVHGQTTAGATVTVGAHISQPL